MKRALLAGAVVLSCTGVAGAAWAVTSGSDGVDACYKRTTGALRVDTGPGCRRNETPITLGTGQVTTRVVTEMDEMAWDDQGVVKPMCAPGEVVIAGGYTIDNIGPNTFVNQDQPIEEDGVQGWLIMATYTAFADDGYDGHVVGWAICTPGATTEAPWLD